jgi:hypothetical protein
LVKAYIQAGINFGCSCDILIGKAVLHCYFIQERFGFGVPLRWRASSGLGNETPSPAGISDVLVQGGYSALFWKVTIQRATLSLEVELLERADDAFWPLLGYCCGSVCGTEIALIRGLEASAAGPDELKAFGAAFATVAAPMFHITGITPEADDQRPERQVRVGPGDLRWAWELLNIAASPEIGLVSLGNPHFSSLSTPGWQHWCGAEPNQQTLR